MVTKFYSAWFCPYAQRAWIALEHHGIPFEYVESLVVEVDQDEGDHGYAKDARLLELNPRGLVPTLDVAPELVDAASDGAARGMPTRRGDALVMTESIDCVKFLNAVGVAKYKAGSDLLPDPDLMDDARKFNESICSPFYKVLMKPTTEERRRAYSSFATGIALFLGKVREGGFYASGTPTIVDVAVVPWLLRIPLLTHYRPSLRLEDELNGDEREKLTKYLARMRGLGAVRKTLWEDESDLIRVYKRYADGSAKSQVGKAVSSGKNAHDV